MPSLNLQLVWLIVWLHFVGDFIIQTDKMALNKSKSWWWLNVHAVTYGLPFLLISWRYATANIAAHFLVDAVTSRINAKLWAANQRHWFFVCIGFDQAVHMSILLWTLKWR